MKKYIALIMLLTITAGAYAQTEATEQASDAPKAAVKVKKMKKVKQPKVKLDKRAELAYTKGKGTVYVFGVSQQLGENTVYVTNINRVDSIDLQKRTKFLPYRSEFSIQLKQYLEGTEKLKKQTACVYYNKSRKKLSKEFYKIKKRYLDNKEKKMVMVDNEKFSFSNPFDMFQ